ncbi:hypothetical protein CABS01_08045 [Colletotrichum abscissum]|uniref:uncharacterized protein n=1 Tax=Colletotrichum abscissum TaxID=1671311 RepID=UPI0027D58D4C|nr:uncharacterized protein CABS01_08045 [Colletotrichum abscissum]KAK1508815.1 hypothetical protein CABS01_08045 [Colletotrichum abscissum]
MAEFFGVAAGVAGFVSLMVQIGEGVSKLRAIHDNAGKAATDISTLIRELDLLTHSVNVRITTYRNSNQLKELTLVSQLHTLPPTGNPPEESASELAPASASDLSQSPTASVGIVPRREKLRAKHRGNCLLRPCSCVCHRTNRTTHRFWALEYTPWGALQQSCDLETCNTTRYGASVRLAFSQFGIRWAAVLEVYTITSAGRFSLRPNLEMEQIVPYTSPGFEIIWRCQTYSIGFEEASESLRQLYRADPQGFSRHVNPGGKSYIEEILRYPWARGNDQTQWELLILFMQEFEMTKGTDSVPFLVQCAQWIGKGPHLYLLELLLDLGYDVSGVVGDFQDWPALSSPNWISEAITPDPFFIEYFKIVCTHNQGFAGMTPLHEAILIESTQTVARWISKSKKDEKNSLGQTPLHLAVSDPQRLKALIDSGHDVNMTDIHGIKPLMYAAAVNQDESPNSTARIAKLKKYGRTFLHYAAVRGHWKLIFRFLVRLEGFADNWIVEGWAESAVLLYHVEYPNLGNLEMREVFLGQLLMKCRTANLTFDDVTSGIKDNCLLHYNTGITDFEALMEQGFRLFNHMNSKGQTPLMVAAELGEPDLVRKLVEVGADVNLKDLHHRTALHFALGRMEKSRGYGFWVAMETLRILLAGGANVFTIDGCRCPCSSFGRLSVVDLLNSSRHWWQGIWEKPPIAAMELLCLTVEYRGAQEGKDLLLSFIRWEKHEERGMSHLCFQRHSADGLYGFVASSRPLCLQAEEVDDILDEESEFLAILETEMEESSAKDFEHLLKDWLKQMKSRLDKVVEEKSRSDAKCVKGQAEVKHGYQVDYKRDCFYHNLVVDVDWPDPTRAIRSSLAMYIAWIEHEYDHGATARLAGPFHKDWYSTRTSMVHKFIEVFCIPTAEIAHALKRSDATIEEERYGHVNIELIIEHFLRPASKYKWIDDRLGKQHTFPTHELAEVFPFERINFYNFRSFSVPFVKSVTWKKMGCLGRRRSG